MSYKLVDFFILFLIKVKIKVRKFKLKNVRKLFLFIRFHYIILLYANN